jgi:hypothetical protein
MRRELRAGSDSGAPNTALERPAGSLSLAAAHCPRSPHMENGSLR